MGEAPTPADDPSALGGLRRWAIDASDDDLLAAIIDREDVLAGESNPQAAMERDVLIDEQHTRDLVKRAEQSLTPQDTARMRAEGMSDGELSAEIARAEAEHKGTPSTDADLAALTTEQDARVEYFAKSVADALMPDEPEQPGARRVVSTDSNTDAAAQPEADEQADSKDSVDKAVELKDRARANLDQFVKWTGRGRMLHGKTGEMFERLHQEGAKWNRVIDKYDRLEDAELLYDATTSFVKLAHVNPQEPEALAKAAGEAVSDFGRLLQKSKLPIVRDYGSALKSMRKLFENMRIMMDPLERPIVKESEIAIEIGKH
jgi:hypothetical protein